MNNYCLVVGAGGFIGSNLCIELSKQYKKVFACDNFFSEGIIQNFKKSNIEIIEGGIEGFVLAQKKYLHLQDIFYFAGKSIPALVETELERGCFSDQEALVMMLSSFSNMNNRVRFIYGSSGGTVYGNTGNKFCQETMSCKPISSYGLSKYIQEQYIQFFARKIGFDYYIARISNPYGRILTHGSKNLQGFIDNIIYKALNDKTIEIWGDGSTVRDFMHIDDLVTAISSLTKKKIPSGIYNIGSGQATSLNDVIEILQYLIQHINISRFKSRDIDVKVNVLDISKINEFTSWSPKIPIRKGMKDLLSIYQKI